jgi:hypothetical protein
MIAAVFLRFVTELRHVQETETHYTDLAPNMDCGLRRGDLLVSIG